MRTVAASRIDEGFDVLVSHCHSRTDLVVSEYLAAWNDADACARWRHLQAAWSAAGRFEDPLVALEDRAAMREHIERCQARNAGARFVVTSDVMQHHDCLHFTWALLDAQGVERLAGSSYCTLDDEGRIRHLVGFFEAALGAD